MSRTKHHRSQKQQHCGEDLWSRRAGMGRCSYTTFNKRLTNRVERAAKRRDIAKEVGESNG